MQIRPYQDEDGAAVVRLSLRAWEPVFESIEQALDPQVFAAFYPGGQSASQKRDVEAICKAPETLVWVAEEDGSPVGFVAVNLHREETYGEIHMLAVDPDYQQRGIGGALTDFAVDQIREAGIPIAMVETGADPGHAPARRTYEKHGFGLFPVARYFKKL